MYLTIIIHIINQPTEVTIVKPDGERVSQADLKAAAEAAEAARIASAKAEEERLQAERLAAEQLAAQKSINGTTSPSNMQDIKVQSFQNAVLVMFLSTIMNTAQKYQNAFH